MQIKIFRVSINDISRGEEETNRFLRGHRVLEAEKQFVQDGANSFWSFCISYLQGGESEGSGHKKKKVDYKSILDDKVFELFSRLRAARKQIAQEEGLPAFAVFTDEELAGIARLEIQDTGSLAKVKGIGKGKIERFGTKILQIINTGEEENEEGG